MPERTNQEWLDLLRSEGPAQQEALEELRRALERAALFYLRRRRASLQDATDDELESLAQDAAQEATLQVLNRLDSFRGEARFLTWASAVAVGRAMTALRRRLWQDVSLDRTPDGWPEPTDATGGWNNPDLSAERREMWEVIRDVVNHELTDRQRTVLNQLVFNGASADDLAARLGTSPGALYKLTHDARRKLKAGLEKRGFSTDEILDAFSAAAR